MSRSRRLFLAGAATALACQKGKADPAETVRRFLGFTDPDPGVDADRTQHGSLVAMGDDVRGRWQVASAQAGAEPLAQLALRTAGMGVSLSGTAPSACRARGA